MSLASKNNLKWKGQKQNQNRCTVHTECRQDWHKDG